MADDFPRIYRHHIDGLDLYSVDVVGESRFQENIWAVVQDRQRSNPEQFFASSHGRETVHVEANLISEPTNPHDLNAIAVYVDGLKVGYLERDRARKLSTQLKANGFAEMRASCKAKITGVYNEDVGSMLFGVKLDLVTKAQQQRAALVSGLKEFEFQVNSPMQTPLAQIGIGVNFWMPSGGSDKISIYCQGGMLGEGLLGYVPQPYVLAIHRQITAGLPVNARITGFDGRSWSIYCKLATQEEVDRVAALQRAERAARLAPQLRTPYHPKKPFEVRFSTGGFNLRKGAQLLVSGYPSVEQIIDQYGPLTVQMTKVRTEEHFTATIEHGTVEKLVRISIYLNPIPMRVVTNHGGHWFSGLVEIPAS